MAYNEYSETAGIKVITDTVSAGLIKILKKYRNGSIADIKNDILHDSYVLSCNLVTDIDAFKEMIQCYDELAKAGYTVESYFSGRKEDIQIFRNWAKRSDEIDEEQELLSELEFEDEE